MVGIVGLCEVIEVGVAWQLGRCRLCSRGPKRLHAHPYRMHCYVALLTGQDKDGIFGMAVPQSTNESALRSGSASTAWMCAFITLLCQAMVQRGHGDPLAISQTNQLAGMPRKQGCGHICRVLFRRGFFHRESPHKPASPISPRICFPRFPHSCMRNLKHV